MVQHHQACAKKLSNTPFGLVCSGQLVAPQIESMHLHLQAKLPAASGSRPEIPMDATQYSQSVQAPLVSDGSGNGHNVE